MGRKTIRNEIYKTINTRRFIYIELDNKYFISDMNGLEKSDKFRGIF
jgi:hypothetical protein